MYTLSEFIERLEGLREITGDDCSVVVSCGQNNFEVACVEVQNVMPPEIVDNDTYWRASNKDNTEKVISVF